jgi:hypothetical protein
MAWPGEAISLAAGVGVPQMGEVIWWKKKGRKDGSD